MPVMISASDVKRTSATDRNSTLLPPPRVVVEHYPADIAHHPGFRRGNRPNCVHATRDQHGSDGDPD